MVLGYDLSLSVSLLTLPRPFQVLKKTATKNQNMFYKFILLKDYAEFFFAMHSERGKQPESVLILFLLGFLIGECLFNNTSFFLSSGELAGKQSYTEAVLSRGFQLFIMHRLKLANSSKFYAFFELLHVIRIIRYWREMIWRALDSVKANNNTQGRSRMPPTI